MPQAKINVVQAMFLFNLAVGITNHVIVVPLILQASHRDAWISALFAIPPLILWTIILYYIMKLTKQQSLFEWFRSHYNSVVAWTVILPLILLCIAILFVTLRDTSAWTKITYLPRTPFPITVTLFALSGIIAAISGLRTVTIAAGILLPAVILCGLFVMSVNYQFKDYSYLKPIFTQGYASILHGTVYTLGGLVEFVLLLGLQQHLNKKFRLSSLLVLTVAVTGLVFGPIIAAISIFGPYESADQRYPAFEQWRMVLIGKFVSHLDFLSIYQWISGSMIRISLAFYLLFDLLQMSRNKWKSAYMLLTGGVLIFCVSQYKLSDSLFYSFLKQLYFPIVMMFFYVFPFALLLLILIKRGKPA
ncbi:GerAB/ArcD/ProY family transporter [Cohnella herbarum]|uniref:Endospore germination permease n=1 Tax=Cohnella herbarum TaxID=2728023 RepID=A0A7Z2VGN6_9BACL|nr:endospore germination permease [Cohnella herbarum]QJD82600.1 endospore germination permease [Cohnella herbarum]